MYEVLSTKKGDLSTKVLRYIYIYNPGNIQKKKGNLSMIIWSK